MLALIQEARLLDSDIDRVTTVSALGTLSNQPQRKFQHRLGHRPRNATPAIGVRPSSDTDLRALAPVAGAGYINHLGDAREWRIVFCLESR